MKIKVNTKKKKQEEPKRTFKKQEWVIGGKKVSKDAYNYAKGQAGFKSPGGKITPEGVDASKRQQNIEAKALREKELMANKKTAQRSVDIEDEKGRLRFQKQLEEARLREGEKTKEGVETIDEGGHIEGPSLTKEEQLKEKAEQVGIEEKEKSDWAKTTWDVTTATAMSAMTSLGPGVGVMAAGAVFGAGGAIATALHGMSWVSKVGIAVGTAFAVDNFLLKPQETAVWAAVDNIASGLSFQTNKIDTGYRRGWIDEEQARLLYNEAIISIDKAREFVDTETIKNPKLWCSRDIYMKAVDTAEQGVLLSKQSIGLS